MTEFVNFSKELLANKLNKDSTEPYITIWGKGIISKTRIASNIFNKLYYNFITAKLKSKNLRTIKNNTISIKNAMNVIYLDGDYHFNIERLQEIKTKLLETTNPDEVEDNYEDEVYTWAEDVMKHIREAHIKYWINMLSEHNIKPCYTFEFEPCDISESSEFYRKGGHHVFFILDKDVSKEDRANYITEFNNKLNEDKTLIDYLKFNTDIDTTDNKWINKLFDKSPICNANPLLLFAQKDSKSRQYICVKHNFNNINFNNFIGINPAEDKDDLTSSSNIITNLDLNDKELDFIKTTLNDPEYKNNENNVYYKLGEDGSIIECDKNLIDSVQNSLKKYLEDDKKYNINKDRDYSEDEPHRIYGKAFVNTLQFVSSLAYLAPQHKLFELMADHNDRMFKFIKPLASFCYISVILYNKRDTNEKEDIDIVNYITDALLPVLARTVKDNSDTTQRDTKASCLKCVANIYYKYVKGAMSEKYKYIWLKYITLSRDEKNNIPTDKQTNSVADNDEELSIEVILKKSKKHENKINFTRRDVDIARDIIQKYIIEWITCVEKTIAQYITTEIEPFIDQGIIKRGMSDCRTGVEFKDFLVREHVGKTKFYYNIMMKWIRMFTFIFYMNVESTSNTTSEIIKLFIRSYIWCNKISPDTKKNTMYIYNIHQTRQLLDFPYNQWISDIDGANIKYWVTELYYTYIYPTLKRTGKTDINIYLNICKLAEFSVREADNIKLKNSDNMSQNIERIFRDVTSTFLTGEGAPIEPIFYENTKTNIFPCHNGILYFHNDGTAEFKTDNKHVYTDGFTNVIYDDNYDYKNPIYKRVERMWKETFPIKEDRVYIMNLIASCLAGEIVKDQFIVLYGTGGDGKTTFCNAIQSMLGLNESANNGMYIDDKGITHNFYNPKGLAASMKTDTILTTNKSGHDEGGRSNLEGARFCTVQEPDQGLSGGKLNCAVIKELLSNSTINARKIYQAARTFQPNCLIILQTNTIPGYTEDTDATRRRISILPMKSKFTTNINKDNLAAHEFTFNADQQFSSHMSNDPRYWTALFMSLLPYTLRLFKKKWIPISNIIRPKTVDNATISSFTNASGLMGYLNQTMGKVKNNRPGKVINIKQLVEDIIERNAVACRERNGKRILLGITESERRQEILTQLLTKFHCIYKLKNSEEFYISKARKRIKQGVINNILNKSDKSELESGQEFIKEFFEPYAISNMSDSMIDNKEDLFIVGYIYNPNKYDEDIPDMIDINKSDDKFKEIELEDDDQDTQNIKDNDAFDEIKI